MKMDSGHQYQVKHVDDVNAKKGKVTLSPLVESQVRRSSRVKGKTKGYKSESCKDKNCIACSAHPPTISSKVIRNLGENFCKIPVQELDDAALCRKNRKKEPVGAGKTSRKSKKDKNDDDAGQPSKKTKKK